MITVLVRPSRANTRSSFTRQAIAAVKVMIVLTLALGVLYPAFVWGVGQVVAREQAAGSLVGSDGHVVGSTLLGQQWTGPEWFHGRPSVSDYSGVVSGGSNLGPGRALDDVVTARREALALGAGPLPPDALTASASGLDPHISMAYAAEQVERVAAARGLPSQTVERVVAAATEGRSLGFVGQERVNVLRLNLALAALSPDAAAK